MASEPRSNEPPAPHEKRRLGCAAHRGLMSARAGRASIGITSAVKEMGPRKDRAMVRIDRVAADPPRSPTWRCPVDKFAAQGNGWTCPIPMPPTGAVRKDCGSTPDFYELLEPGLSFFHYA
jgi:hypothetical protein